MSFTGWQRPTECFKMQVIFRKRASNYRALLRERTHISSLGGRRLISLEEKIPSIHLFWPFVSSLLTTHFIVWDDWCLCGRWFPQLISSDHSFSSLLTIHLISFDHSSLGVRRLMSLWKTIPTTHLFWPLVCISFDHSFSSLLTTHLFSFYHSFICVRRLMSL